MKVSIIIPTLNAQNCLQGLIAAISHQTEQECEIIIIDSQSDDDTPKIAKRMGATLAGIRREEFNHGATRNLANTLAKGEYLVFLTQDVLPIDEWMLDQLIAPLKDDPLVAVSYGRQIAYPHARPLERFVREFNYPPLSQSKSRTDIARLGIKTFFCSNACAAYRKETFQALGSFRVDTIMNEDMEFVYRAIMQGYRVYYAADAKVWHSHDYSFCQQLQRYVDIGVFFCHNPDLSACAMNEGEGLRYLHEAFRFLLQSRYYGEFLHLGWDTGARLLGYRLGRRYRWLPRALVQRLSMNKGYWLHETHHH